MLDQAIVNRIDASIAAYLAPRERTLRNNLQTALRQLAARGGVGSGNMSHQLGQIGADELTVRARITWHAIQRAHNAAGSTVNATTLQDLKGQLTHHINAQAAQVRAATIGAVPRLPHREPLIDHIEDAISTNAREIRAQLDVEAGFYVDELLHQAAQPRPAAPVTINAGHIGAVQTGAYSVANVTISAHDGVRLVEALDALRQSLQANAEATPEQRAQGDELSGDLIAAVKADKPNGPKIAGLFGGLATTLQTVASLRPAWELVRDAAIAAGILISSFGG